VIKISSREVIDIVRYSESKIIFAEKVPLPQMNQYKVNYFILNFDSGEKEVITKRAYLLKKFGYAFEKISETIADFVQCEAVILADKSVLVIFPNGQSGLFDREGNMLWNKELRYNDSVVSSLAYDKDAFWCVCENENCVIRYSTDNFTIDIRVGSKEADTFQRPQFVSADEKNVYVCCKDNRVRSISKDNLIVSDVRGDFENIQRYYRFGRFSILCKADGTYIDKEE